MKFFRLLISPWIAVFAAGFAPVQAEEPDPGKIEMSVGRLLESGHYSRKKLDDNVSRLLLKNYLEGLDYNHLYFTQKDVDEFTEKYGTTLDDDILFGNTEPAFSIYNRYKKRVEDRVAKVKALLTQKFDFKSDRTIEVNRQKSAWPQDEAEADQLWRDRVEGELLQDTLARGDKVAAKIEKDADAAKLETDAPAPKIDKEPAPLKPEKDPAGRLTKRYDQLVRSLKEQSKEDVVKIFLSVLSQTYDPAFRIHEQERAG